MKKNLLLFFSLLMLGSLSLAQGSKDLLAQIDAAATTKAPWKVGERTVDKEICYPYKSDEQLCYTVFLGVTKNGGVLVQDFYTPQLKQEGQDVDATEKKQSDPYQVTSFDAAKLSMEDRMKYTPSVDGAQTFYFRNGQKELEAFYKRGTPHGLWIWWHDNGQRAMEKNYRDNVLNGAWHAWFVNGQKEYEGHYKNDDMVGVWRQWTVDGHLVEEFDFGGDKQ